MKTSSLAFIFVMMLIAFILLFGCASLDSYVPTNSPKFNPYENRYEIANELWKMKYNYLEKEWRYVPGDSQLRFNYYEQKYEWAK